MATESETLDWPQWDGIASTLISFLLTGVAFFLAHEMKQLLIGQAAAVIDKAETAFQAEVPEATRIFAELEPGL